MRASFLTTYFPKGKYSSTGVVQAKPMMWLYKNYMYQYNIYADLGLKKRWNLLLSFSSHLQID